MKILIVDDEPVMRSMVADVLLDSHLASQEKIFMAADGSEALAVFQKEPADIVITDMMMPVMNGSDFIRQLRKISQNTPIIVMTGFADMEMASQVIREKVDELIPKPFSADVLKFSVQNVMTKLRLVRESDEFKAKLLSSEKLASIGLLAAGMAHEINNPNTYVKGNLELLLKYLEVIEPYLSVEAVTDVSQKNKIEIARKNLRTTVTSAIDGSNRIQKIVASLLSYSRSDAGGRNLYRLQDCVDDAIELTKNRTKKHEFALTVQPDLKPISVNRHEITQVVMNLIVNAIDAIEQRHQGRSGRLEISIFTDEGGENQKMVFSDNGGGISEEVRHKIFDPFFTTKPIGKGTGLGLSLAKNCIEAHGGQLMCESVFGEGTRFTLVFPTRGLSVFSQDNAESRTAGG